jgi:hypothetical protein
MSEVLIDVASRFGVPVAVMGFALYWYYKLSQQVIEQSIKREEVLRVESTTRESQMRETIRAFNGSTEKMNVTLGNVNNSMIKIDTNLSRNNKILEQICRESGIKIIPSLIGGNGEGN